MNADAEEWRTVPDWPLYEVSTWGRLQSHHLNRVAILTGGRDKGGYRRALLCHGGLRKSIKLHHMVLWAFHGPKPPGLVGRHEDGDLNNNRPDNLSWATQRENILDKITHGTMPRGEQHVRAKLTAAKVLAIRASDESGVILAARYGVTKATISSAKTGRNWAWL